MESGTKLGHYEILAPLGAGGMGQVYRAHDTTLERDVALKVIPKDIATDPANRARFEREAKLLASLNHPNIATVFGFEESGEFHCIAMELVEGESLADLLSGPLPIAEALSLCGQVAEALEAAHRTGIIHRDLKPANVMVTAERRAKVLDFGIAKVVEGGAGSGETSKLTELTRTGIIVGTAPYMSPEQVRDQSVDKRTDIWAFGCVLYETLTGKRAFERETVGDTLSAILEHEPDWSVLPNKTPMVVDSLLRRCLQKDPLLRLRDVGDAWVEINEVLTSSPGIRHAVATTGGFRGRSGIRRIGYAGGRLAYWQPRQPLQSAS